MSKLFKRIFKDIRDFKHGNLNESGIYCHFSEKNVRKVRILIIGPKDTPYEGGFYLFNLLFPDNYPLNPPSVQFVTYGPDCNTGPIRFNPNLYTNGKVCLSILGTWSGPSWTACCTLTTVLLSIQSLLNESPIHNEPGWETISNDDTRVIKYNSILKYANYRVSILDTLSNIPNDFTVFRDIMVRHLRNIKNDIINYIELNDNSEAYLTSSMFNLKIKYDLFKLKEDLNNILHYYRDIDTEKSSIGSTNQSVNDYTVNTSHKNNRKVPNGSASLYDYGFEKLSENDGKMYVIYKTKTGRNRWKIKTN